MAGEEVVLAEVEVVIAEDLTDAMTVVDAIGEVNVYLTNKNPATGGVFVFVLRGREVRPV